MSGPAGLVVNGIPLNVTGEWQTFELGLREVPAVWFEWTYALIHIDNILIDGPPLEAAASGQPVHNPEPSSALLLALGLPVWRRVLG